MLTLYSSVVIHHLRTMFARSNEVVAYFYCSRKSSRPQKCVDIIASLLRQVVLRDQANVDMVKTEYYKHGKGTIRMHLSIYVELLSTLLKNFHQSFLVLDALDEYSGQGDESEVSTTIDIFEKLQEIMAKAGSSCRLFLTSRENCRAQYRHLKKTKIRIEAKDEDVKLYIRSRIQDNSFRHADAVKADPNVRDDIVTTLAGKAKGQYVP